MTSYEWVDRLPSIADLRRHSRALAMAEAVLCPEPEYRFYGYQPQWTDGVDLATMRDGSGDEYSIVFTDAGALILGFDHESTMSPTNNDETVWPGVADDVPEAFAAFLTEPAFHFDSYLSVTFCLWRLTGDDQWSTGTIEFPPGRGRGDDIDGSDMLDMVSDPATGAYVDFAADIYELELDRGAVAPLWALTPLTEDAVRALRSDRGLDDVRKDADDMGYPIAG